MKNAIEIEAYRQAEQIIAQAHSNALADKRRHFERRKAMKNKLDILQSEPAAINWADHVRIASIAEGKSCPDDLAFARRLIIEDLQAKVAEVCLALDISAEAILASIGTAVVAEATAS